MSNLPIIITIGREFGSGGHEIGKLISEQHSIPLYDSELLALSAVDSGLSREVIHRYDEKNSITPFSFPADSTIQFGGLTPIDLQLSIQQRVFLAQFDTILKLAQNGSCVFVGRCSNYILKDMANVFNVFLYASLESRIERIMTLNKLTHDQAKALIRKMDKQRKNYYNFCADGNWGKYSSYDAMLCTDNMDYNTLASLIYSLAQSRRVAL